MADCGSKIYVKTYHIAGRHSQSPGTSSSAYGDKQTPIRRHETATHGKTTQPSLSLAVQRQTERCMWSFRE